MAKKSIIDVDRLPSGRWVCTDPDSQQYFLLRESNTYEFTFVDSAELPDGNVVVYTMDVSFKEICKNKDELLSILASYGYCEEDDKFTSVMEELVKTFGKGFAHELVCECFFESLALWEYDSVWGFDSIGQAHDFIRKLVKKVE